MRTIVALGLAWVVGAVAVSAGAQESPDIERLLTWVVDSEQPRDQRLDACRWLAKGAPAEAFPKLVDSVQTVAANHGEMTRALARVAPLHASLSDLLKSTAGGEIDHEVRRIEEGLPVEAMILEALQRATLRMVARTNVDVGSVADKLVRASRITTATLTAERESAVAGLACCPCGPARTTLSGLVRDKDADVARFAVDGLRMQAREAKDTHAFWARTFSRLWSEAGRRVRRQERTRATYRKNAKKVVAEQARAAARLTDVLKRALSGELGKRKPPPEPVASRKNYLATARGERQLVACERLLAVLPAALRRAYERVPPEKRSAAIGPALAGIGQSDADRATLSIALVAQIDSAEVRAAIAQAAASRSPDVRVAACTALGSLRVPAEAAASLASTLATALTDEFWQVRIAAVGSLRRLATAESVDGLIAALPVQDGRVREAIVDALGARTGMTFGDESARWASWWRDHRSAYDRAAKDKPVKAAPSPKGIATFFDVPVRSRSVAFLINTAVVASLVKSDDESAETLGELIGELTRCVEALPASVTVKVGVFGSRVKAWKPKPVEATNRNKRSLIKWLRATEQSDGTNTGDGIAWAVGAPADGTMPTLRADAPDTVFMVSTARATRGAMTNRLSLAHEFERLNRRALVRVHAIAFESHADVALMRAIAKASGGEFHRRVLPD